MSKFSQRILTGSRTLATRSRKVTAQARHGRRAQKAVALRSEAEPKRLGILDFNFRYDIRRNCEENS